MCDIAKIRWLRPLDKILLEPPKRGVRKARVKVVDDTGTPTAIKMGGASLAAAGSNHAHVEI